MIVNNRKKEGNCFH